MFRIKTFFIFCIATLFSCNKDESSTNNGNSLNVLLKSVVIESKPYYEYTYNPLNQILEEKSKWHYTKYNYDHSVLISSDHYVDRNIFSSNSYKADPAFERNEWVNSGNTPLYNSTNYFYDNNNRLYKSSDQLGYSIYSYNGNNLINRQTLYHNEKETGYINFYYDKKGNLATKKHYIILKSGNAELQTTTEYEYDNKFNPYKVFKHIAIPGIYTNINNIIREIYTIEFNPGPSVEKVQIKEYTYEYNEKGYPVKKNNSTELIYY